MPNSARHSPVKCCTCVGHTSFVGRRAASIEQCRSKNNSKLGGEGGPTAGAGEVEPNRYGALELSFPQAADKGFNRLHGSSENHQVRLMLPDR